MDHVVYLDAKAGELENLLSGAKSMIIRGAAGRKMPYGRVEVGDHLYFINNNAEGTIRAKASVNTVLNSDKMDQEQSVAFVRENQDKLKLTDKQFQRWAGKRYLVLIEVENVIELKPFEIDRSNYGNMDDWLPVKDINKVNISFTGG
ncbi:MAG: hypothetical protein SCK29_05525 [Bacillota bacterium]|nr:hypothetical protein [Bacillota bacterium]MDW7683564.1 hypothetical protein [Bacillota bacterium]